MEFSLHLNLKDKKISKKGRISLQEILVMGDQLIKKEKLER